YDKDVAKLNGDLAKTCLVWGTTAMRREGEAKDAEARGLVTYEAASRVAFQAKNRQLNAYDLLDNIRQGKVKLEDVKEDQLPEQLRKLRTVKERKEYLAKLETTRKELNQKVLELDKKRSDWLARKQAADAKKGKAGFDAQVV